LHEGFVVHIQVVQLKIVQVRPRFPVLGLNDDLANATA
jgi:hypothetical protein